MKKKKNLLPAKSPLNCIQTLKGKKKRQRNVKTNIIEKIKWFEQKFDDMKEKRRINNERRQVERQVHTFMVATTRRDF